MNYKISFGRSITLVLTAIILTWISTPARGQVTLLDKDEWKVQLGGFAELDMFNDSTRSFTETAGNGPVSQAASPRARVTMGGLSSPRETLAFPSPSCPPYSRTGRQRGTSSSTFWALKNGPTEAKLYTHPDLRLRHAYLSAESDGWQILAGQYWSLFGWQTYYLTPTVSVPPVAGVTYERNPQLLLMKTMGSLQAGLSVFRPIQADSQLPGLDAGVRWSFDGWKTGFTNSPTGEVTVQPLSVAVTGTARNFEAMGGTITTQVQRGAYGVAADGMIPILPASDSKDVGNSLAFIGEFTTGEGYGDIFPSWTGNLGVPANTNLDAGIGGVDSSGTFQLVKLMSFNLNLQYQLPSDFHTYVNVGYGQLNSSNANTLTAAAAVGGVKPVIYTKAEVDHANVYHNFTNQIRAGLEYAYFDTTYADNVIAHNNRVQLSTWFRL